jgi:uncharacterized membrane protein (UPF0136 family)
MTTRKLGNWLIAYGLFLIVIGLIGYLSNPEKARTALMSGGTFGAISMVWGLLLRGGMIWARVGALVTTSFLAVVFVWRSSAGWMAVARGETEKGLAAVLITLMLLASAAVIVLLIRNRVTTPVQTGAGA